MNSRLKSTLLVLFALTTVATGILAWQQNSALRSTQVASADTDLTALEKRLAEAEHRAHALQNELDALKAKSSADTAIVDEPPPPPNDGFREGEGRFRGGPNGGMRELMNDPKVMAVVNAREKQMLDQRYAQLFKNLIQAGKLTPEQVETFKNLLVERQNTLRDIRQSAREQGITDRSQIDALVKSTQAELDAQLQNTLGAAAYAEYQAYEKTYPQRSFVNWFAQSLSYTSAPLNDAQTQQLVDLLASNSTANSNNRRQGTFGGGVNVAVTDTALTAAATVLNATQLAALTELQRQQKAQEELRQSIRAARQNTTATTTPSATKAGK